MGQERDGSPFAHKPKVPIIMSTPENLEVLYEDNHIIAVNKRSSDIVQGDITNDRTLDNVIREYLRVKYGKPGEAWLGTIHRIDRPVSGVILYAKTSKCLSRMMKAFKHREVAKTYWAVVKGEPPQAVGHVVNYLRKNSERNKSYAYDTPGKDRKESELKYYLLGKGDHYHFVEVQPKSGRHHHGQGKIRGTARRGVAARMQGPQARPTSRARHHDRPAREKLSAAHCDLGSSG